ncbi:MAG: DUF4416 family protein [Candidatus Brocadiia bacterium]
MGEILTQPPVKLFAGLISGYPQLLSKAESALASEFGPIELRSDPMVFDFTDYYDKEMGPNLKRVFLSFQKPVMPDEIARIKLLTNRMEKELAGQLSGKSADNPALMRGETVTRPINIDPGYLDRSKMILVTTKDYNHRIYLKDGIYAEVTLQYKAKEGFQPFPWAYPDYRTKPYLDFFNKARTIYAKQVSQS